MNMLMETAKEYAKLFDKDYIYTLETGTVLQVYFIPGFFYHLMGLQKLMDIPAVRKGSRNSAYYIFRSIMSGTITLGNIQKSKYFNEIENRLRHFSQINKMVEFEKVIIDFDPSLIRSKMLNASYILFKSSNDNMHLNLFLKTDESNQEKHIPLTFLADPSGYYIHGQKVVNILSMSIVSRINKNRQL